MRRVSWLLLVVLAGGVSDVGGQTRRTERGFLTASLFSQWTSDAGFTAPLSHPPSAPALHYDIRHDLGDGGLTVELGGGLRVWRNMSAGLVVSMHGAPATVHAHAQRRNFGPSGDERPPIYGDYVTFDHRQTAYHGRLTWTVPVTDRFDVAFFAGPSVFRVRHARVADVVMTPLELWPGHSVSPSVAGATTRRVLGLNYGFDFIIRVNRHVGVVIQSSDTVSTLSGGNESPRPSVGGAHLGIGARLGF